MKVLDINSVLKEESGIYYINRYKGTAVLDVLAQKIDLPISFSIEITPFGSKNIEIDIGKLEINYPVMPITKQLKARIEEMSANGTLP